MEIFESMGSLSKDYRTKHQELHHVFGGYQAMHQRYRDLLESLRTLPQTFHLMEESERLKLRKEQDVLMDQYRKLEASLETDKQKDQFLLPVLALATDHFIKPPPRKRKVLKPYQSSSV